MWISTIISEFWGFDSRRRRRDRCEADLTLQYWAHNKLSRASRKDIPQEVRWMNLSRTFGSVSLSLSDKAAHPYAIIGHPTIRYLPPFSDRGPSKLEPARPRLESNHSSLIYSSSPHLMHLCRKLSQGTSRAFRRVSSSSSLS